MTKWLTGLLCLVITIVTTQTALAATDLAILEDSKSFREGDSFVTELNFSKSIEGSEATVEYINETVQVNIKGATIASGKDLKRLEDDQIQSVFTYQYEPNLMRTRIIYHSTKAESLKGFVKLETKGDKLKISVMDPNGVKNASRTETPVAHMPPIDLDKELEKAFSVNGEEKQEVANSEEAELMAAASKFEKEMSSEREIASTEENNEKTEAATVAEENIPLNLEAKAINAESNSPWTRLFISLAVIGVVGIGLIVGVKRFAKDKVHVGGNVKVKVVSQHSLGPKKSLAVIHVAGESILIGITDHNISMIKSLALIDDEIEEETPTNFHSEIQKANSKDTYTRQPAPKITQAVAKADHDDEFSIGNIKDLVSSKLKEMRPL